MKFVTAILASAAFSVSAANAITFEFEPDSAASVAINNIIVGGIDYGDITTVSTNGVNQLIAYNSLPPVGQDPDLEGPFQNIDNAADIRNGFGNLGIISKNPAPFTAPNDSATGGQITFVFDSLVTFDEITIFDTKNCGKSKCTTVTAFGDEDGNIQLASQTITQNLEDSNGTNFFKTLSFGTSLVKMVVVDIKNDSGAIDQLKFATGTNIDQPVPVPGALPLMLTGAAAFAARRRRRQA
ncbi:MAG: PEP-CTERM sorting domain-containing protein [Pseudomonadota bacterium]